MRITADHIQGSYEPLTEADLQVQKLQQMSQLAITRNQLIHCCNGATDMIRLRLTSHRSDERNRI